MFTIIKMLLKNDMVASLIVLLIFIALLMTSCASNEKRDYSVISEYSKTAKNDAINTELVDRNIQSSTAISMADYAIGPEDLIEFNVFQVAELHSTVRVSAKGYIKLPLIDNILAAGHTVSELESLISERLKTYVKDPIVSVFIKEYRSQQISVLGSVRNPSVYFVTGQKYLLDMLSMAGGLTPDAGSVCIIRKAPKAENGKIEKIVIELEELLLSGNDELNIPVSAGDIIHVPKSGIFFVDGAVKSPGEFMLQKHTTLTQAISKAKGLQYVASRSGIKIVRIQGNRERMIIPIEYDLILNGKNPDIPIQDKDIIIVSESAFKRFISTLSGGFNFSSFRLGGGF
jgi:polysaccharide export outer membrane protein